MTGMKELSILLCLDGSAQCKYAMDVCFEWARHLPVRVAAQHVVDSIGLWDFLAHDEPGLVGSGLYMAAREAMYRELRSIGETLIEVYNSHAGSSSANGGAFLDEGSPVREIYRRSADYDLVVIGHHPSQLRSPAEERRRFARFSLAERLAYYIKRPLLIVQARSEPWRSIFAMLTVRHGLPASLAGIMDLGAALEVPVTICFVTDGDHEEERIPERIAALKRLRADSKWPAPAIASVRNSVSSWTPSVELAPDTLVALPMLDVAESRETALGVPVDLFVRHAPYPAILLCPEVAPQAQAQAPAGKARTR